MYIYRERDLHVDYVYVYIYIHIYIYIYVSVRRTYVLSPPSGSLVGGGYNFDTNYVRCF